MQPANLWNKILQKSWNLYSEDVGKSLIHLGAFGWFLSAAAQITMLAKNKDIDKKEKQFLIPQEIADGVINVGLYYTICQAIKLGCEQLLERGIFMTEKSFNTILQIKPSSNSIGDYLKAMNETFAARGFLSKKKIPNIGRLSNFYNVSMYILDNPKIAKNKDAFFRNNPIMKATFEQIFEQGKVKQTKRFLNRAFKDYKLFKNGIGVIAAVGASVLACNIITPITRNITANHFQKKAMKRNSIQQDTTLQAYNLPVSNTFNNFKI